MTFVGLSADGRALVVADSTGTQYRLDVDARLSAALGLPIRPGTVSDQGRIRSHGQLEIALQPLSPKDIQARIRAGATVAEVAEQAGESPERIERFAGPPLADRAHAAEQARRSLVRGGVGTLDDVVSGHVEGRGLSLDDVRWDAWRREDGTWTVIAFLPAAAGVEAVASWTFDPASRQVVSDDVTALLPSAVATSATSALRLVPDAPADRPVVAEVVPAPRPAHAAQDETPADAEAPAAQEPATARGRGKKRASVPTWDEILFGATTPPGSE